MARRGGPSSMRMLHADCAVDHGDAEARRFLGERLDHQARGARPATGGAARLVVVGLVAQRGAEAVVRDRQSHELQRGERAQRADRLDIGGVLVHRAAGAERRGERVEIVAAGRCRTRCARSACPNPSRRTCRRRCFAWRRRHRRRAASSRPRRASPLRRCRAPAPRSGRAAASARATRRLSRAARPDRRLGHRDVGQGVENGLRKRSGQARFLPHWAD